jgi:tetratricopeptide (TPR) repeat protein
MQEQVKSLNKNYHWLETVESVAVIGSVGGAIASAISQQVIFASLPFSAAVLLNLINRKLLITSIQHQQASIKVLEQNTISQERLAAISSQVAQLQQANVNLIRTQTENNAALTQLREANSIIENKLEQLKYQAELQPNAINSIQASEQRYQDTPEDIQKLLNEQAKLAKTVHYLQEIDRCNQTIQLDPNSAVAYYDRAQIYEQLGEKAAAIADYDQAIHLNTNYTEAYYNRGLACIELGRKKQALKDFRAAAKLFFAKGDIENYQKAKSLSQEIYELKTLNTNTNNMLLVGKMFSTTVNWSIDALKYMNYFYEFSISNFGIARTRSIWTSFQSNLHTD